MRRAAALGAALLAALALLSGCRTTEVPRPTPASGVTTSPLALLPAAGTAVPQPMRLATGLVPPTNRWFSGLVFGDRPWPVFPEPLAVVPSLKGLSVVLPTVTASADTIAASTAGGLGLDLGADRMEVAAYDDLTVTMRYRSGDAEVADVLLAEGWPYVAVTARRDLAIGLSAEPSPAGDGLWRAEVGGVPYLLRAPGGSVDGDRLRLPAGSTAVVFAVPATADEASLVAGAAGVVTGGSAGGSVDGATATTTLRYRTAGGRPTVLAERAGTTTWGATCDAGTVATTHGPAALCRGTTLRTVVPAVAPSASLDLSRASAAERARIARTVAADLAATPAEPADSYGGGKWLYRLAMLLQLAKAVGTDADVAEARRLLDPALLEWAQADGCRTRTQHCFVADTTVGGVVGHAASFGSDQFNDHHFHYGYLLTAAAVAAADRPELLPRLRPVLDLVAADIGSPAATADLPAHRGFDAYAGHSWASGTAPFADGNDEESSSEAVNAWNGLALWAGVTGDAALRREAVWLLSAESASARRDWLQPDLTAFPAYRHAFVSLEWSGKRDSATWFSADPAAKLGIQLIPMPPVAAAALGADPARVRRNLAEGRSGGSALFADYLLMYQALADGDAPDLRRAAVALPASAIDAADSRAYLLAWLAAQRR